MSLLLAVPMTDAETWDHLMWLGLAVFAVWTALRLLSLWERR